MFTMVGNPTPLAAHKPKSNKARKTQFMLLTLNTVLERNTATRKRKRRKTKRKLEYIYRTHSECNRAVEEPPLHSATQKTCHKGGHNCMGQAPIPDNPCRHQGTGRGRREFETHARKAGGQTPAQSSKKASQKQHPRPNSTQGPTVGDGDWLKQRRAHEG